jgi:hypothetical protein
MKILITSRDVGAAKQNLAFLENIFAANLYAEIKILAQQPAFKIFQKSNFKCTLLGEDCEKACESIIAEFKPDFVLLGLSGFKIGIDEIVRGLCKIKNIKCGVIQDYWGYTGGFDQDSLPNYFFVIDRQAERLTLLNTKGKANCIVSGSPKHEQYGYMIKKWISDNPFNSSKNSLLLVGQPYEMPGYLENIDYLFRALEGVSRSFDLFIKDHPNNKKEIYSDMLNKYSYPFHILDENHAIEPALVNATIVINCCSTAGLDHSFMKFYSKQAIGGLLYLSIGEDIKNFFKKSVGPIDLEELISGMGLVAYSKKEITAHINKLLEYNYDQYISQVIQNLQSTNHPSKNIYKYIESSVLFN